MDSNAVFAILLLIVGLAILSAEIFVPSGGLLGLITFLSLLVSLVFAYRAWGTSHPNIFAVFCVMLLLLVPTVLSLGFYMLPRTSFGKKVLLEGPDAKKLAPYSKQSTHLQQLVGRYGVAVTMLNPGGLVSLDGERLHATSEGLSVDPGTSVEIINIRGASVVVRPGTPMQTPSDSDKTNSEVMSPLDFEFPPI